MADTEYGHDEAMRDLDMLDSCHNFIQPIAAPFNFNRLRAYIAKVEAERDWLATMERGCPNRQGCISPNCDRCWLDAAKEASCPTP